MKVKILPIFMILLLFAGLALSRVQASSDRLTRAVSFISISAASTVGMRTEKPGPFLHWPLPSDIKLTKITRLPDTPWTHSFLGITNCPPYPALIDYGYWPYGDSKGYYSDNRHLILPGISDDQVKWQNQDNGKPGLGNAFACYRGHAGADISSDEGTDVLAAAVADKVWVEIDNAGDYRVTLRHPNVNGLGQDWYTVYVHLSSSIYAPGVYEGVDIPAGQEIGTVGQLVHLHFQVAIDPDYKDSYARNPWGIDQPPWDGCLWIDHTLCPINPSPYPDNPQGPSLGHFVDVGPDNEFFPYIETLYGTDVVSGTGNNNYQPNNFAARGQAAKVIILGIDKYVEHLDTTSPYTDVHYSDIFFHHIWRMKELGIADGYSDGSYRPDELMLRGDLAKFIIRARGESPTYLNCLAPFPDVPCDNPNYQFIRRLKEIFEQKNIELGFSDGTYRSDAPATRAEMAKLVVGGFDRLTDQIPIFYDVLHDDKFFNNVQNIGRRQITTGCNPSLPYRIYCPDQALTRGQAAKFVVRGIGEEPAGQYNDNLQLFSDVPTNHTFYAEIQRLTELEIISGYSDGTYKPDEPITRGQMAKIIVNGLKHLDVTCRYDQDPDFSDVAPNHPFYESIQCLKELGITHGYSDDTFRPDTQINREQAAKFMDLAFINRTPAIRQEFTNGGNSNCLTAPILPLPWFLVIPPGDQDCFPFSILDNILPVTFQTSGAATEIQTGLGAYRLANEDIGLNADLRVEILDTDGSTVLATSAGRGQNGGTSLLWTPPAPGTYYVRLTNTNPFAKEGVYAYFSAEPTTPAWSNVCVGQRMEITGVGMGNNAGTINPQTVTLADPNNVNELLVQVAGRSNNGTEQVTFTSAAPQLTKLNNSSNDNGRSYTFETELQPSERITVSVTQPGGGPKTPRGLILYSQRVVDEEWTSVGKTSNGFVQNEPGRRTYREILTFPPLEEPTDLYLTAAIIDNDNDDRPLVLQARAGSVRRSVTKLNSTEGRLLSIINLTLPQVPVGTDAITVTFHSPQDNGDDGALVGLNISYPCPAPLTGAMVHVNPFPVTLPLAATERLTITVTPGPAQVNGVQIHGRVDPTYLHLVNVQPTGVLPVVLDPVTFNPATGEFRYGGGLLGGVITHPTGVLVLEVQTVATTTDEFTLVEFLTTEPGTGVSGPTGSVLDRVRHGLVAIAPTALQGSVALQRRPAQSAAPWVVPLTVWLSPPGGNAAYTFTTTTNQRGEFMLDLTAVPTGLYDLRVKGSHTLRNLAQNVNLVAGENPYFLGQLLEGDVETDNTFNEIAMADTDLLVGSLNKCSTDSDFIANADLDESGCVQLPDFGLLSSNFGKVGDILITTTTNLDPDSLDDDFPIEEDNPVDDNAPQVSQEITGLLAFNTPIMQVKANELVTVTLDIDPRGALVNGGMAQLNFDPALVEVISVTLTADLPYVLAEPVIDNQQGLVSFGAGLIGQTLNSKFTLATLILKLKSATPGAAITLADPLGVTDVSGPAGSVLAETRGLTLTTESVAGHIIYLPSIVKK